MKCPPYAMLIQVVYKGLSNTMSRVSLEASWMLSSGGGNRHTEMDHEEERAIIDHRTIWSLDTISPSRRTPVQSTSATQQIRPRIERFSMMPGVRACPIRRFESRRSHFRATELMWLWLREIHNQNKNANETLCARAVLGYDSLNHKRRWFCYTVEAEKSSFWGSTLLRAVLRPTSEFYNF